MDSEVKREEISILQSRLDGVLNDGESWRNDLEEREKRVRTLEDQMEEWQTKKQEAREERARLDGIHEEVRQARRSLELDIAQAQTNIDRTVSSVYNNEPNDPSSDDGSLERQLMSLRETHAATLADLSTVTGKYRDALKEISDLAGQINEIKLGSPSRSESPERFPDTPVAGARRRINSRGTREPSDPQLNAVGRRLFFRQAASTESLHSR